MPITLPLTDITQANPTRRGGFWPLRDIPVVLWLLAVPPVALLHDEIAAPRWLLIHLLVLGAATHSIFVWSRHFADALLKTPNRRRTGQNWRLATLNAGVLLVLIGVDIDHWPVTAVGATAVATAVLAHGAALAIQMKRALPTRFRAVVRYYVASACCLPVGALLGVLVNRGLPGDLADRSVFAHATVNLLGWIGLPVIGTVVTLWPTVLRTRIDDRAEDASRTALPVLLASIVLSAGGALLGWRPAVAVGYAGYLLALVPLAAALVRTARTRRTREFPALSLGAGMAWLAGALGATAVLTAVAPDWATAGADLDMTAPLLAAGFGAQVLLGALSYLIPVVLGGGPVAVKAGNSVFSQWAITRVLATNVGLVLAAWSPTAQVGWVLTLVSLATFLPLMVAAMRASRRARNGGQGRSASRARPSMDAQPDRVK